MTGATLPVRPDVLAWARVTAGVDATEAARRVAVKPSRIEQWESGDATPTVIQLRKLADAYDRPLAALLLQAPVDDVRFDLPDFRRPASEGEESATLRKAILRAQRQQDALREVLDEGGDLAIPEPQIIELVDDDAERAGAQLRKALGIDQMRTWVVQHPEDFLRALVRNVERRGYLVIQVQRVPTGEMRGFSLSGGVVPLVALNGADWPRGKVFTLLHELVHIGLRHSGLCDLSRQSEAPEERYCDAVAAAALMPAAKFTNLIQSANPRRYADLRRLADGFGVSAESALIRMIETGGATWDDYDAMRDEFRDAYDQFKRDEKDDGADKNKPLYYRLKVRDLGRPFIASIIRAHNDGALSSRDAAALLDVTYDKIPRLASEASTGEGVA
jgi:Zn-dependent peptidase ImmA (M78 family)/transcriptional regulator with XRE-family HTH domain